MPQQAHSDPVISPDDLHDQLADFAELNHRRIFGSPGLSVAEVGRWIELRSRLEAHFGARQPNAWKALEQREFLRLPTHIRIEFGSGGEIESGILSDVSDGGLFIASARLLEIDSPVSLTLAAGDSGAAVEVTGKVVRTREQARDGAPAGMGIAFGDLSAEQRDAVSWLICKLSETDPPDSHS